MHRSDRRLRSFRIDSDRNRSDRTRRTVWLFSGSIDLSDQPGADGNAFFEHAGHRRQLRICKEAAGTSDRLCISADVHSPAGIGIDLCHWICKLCRCHLPGCEPESSGSWCFDCGSDCEPDRIKNLCKGSEGYGIFASHFLVYLYHLRSSEGRLVCYGIQRSQYHAERNQEFPAGCNPSFICLRWCKLPCRKWRRN